MHVVIRATSTQSVSRKSFYAGGKSKTDIVQEKLNKDLSCDPSVQQDASSRRSTSVAQR